MKPFTLLTLFSTFVAFAAAVPHNNGDSSTKKCKPRPATTTINSSPTDSNNTPGDSNNTPDNSNNTPANPPAPTNPDPTPTPPTSSGGTSGSSDGKKIINVKSDGRCGGVGATATTTDDAGPNGSFNWLYCGFENDGWNPEFVAISDLVYVSLDEAVQPGNAFAQCAPYLDFFKQHGAKNNIPPILLASIAMQESNCQPTIVGKAGEQGLMQITEAKCGNVPNCQDPDFNIGKGAEFFSGVLQNSGGNVLVAIASYNGLAPGMTKKKADDQGPCSFDYDYLYKAVNVWLQNIDGHGGIGRYHNLAACGY